MESYGSTTVRKLKTGNSTPLTAGIIIADVVGAGILSMAVAVAKIGWAPGIVGIVLLLALNVHISVVMWRVRMDFPEARTYTQLMEAGFARAPSFQRQLVAVCTPISQHTFIFAALGLYTLSIGRALAGLFPDTHLCLPSWTLLGSLLILPITVSARTMGKWHGLVWLNCATIVGTCLIPLLYMALHGVHASRLTDSSVYTVAPDLEAPGIMSALATFTFAFTSQLMLVEIMSEMGDITEFPRAYVLMAAPFQAVAFLATGIIGYLYLGDKASGMIGDNIPFGLASRGAAMCLLAHMLVTYLIKAIVIARAAQGTLLNENVVNEDTPEAWTSWAVIVTLLTVCTWISSQLVPFFADAVELIGAFAAPTSCYILPLAVYIRWLYDFCGDKLNPESRPAWRQWPGLVELTIIGLELALAVVIMVSGTYFVMTAILEKWDVYGPPFACHCEGIWRTCACSRDHAGMAAQCHAPQLMETAEQPFLGPM